MVPVVVPLVVPARSGGGTGGSTGSENGKQNTRKSRVQEVSRYRSQINCPSLIAPEHITFWELFHH